MAKTGVDSGVDDPPSQKGRRDVDKVRASRDGDQFHYVWAARRCLRLLSQGDGLCAIAIEGPSPDEGATAPGEHLIDVAEYYGSQSLGKATRIRNLQLKHSTHRASQPWTPGELKPTIEGFAARYEAQVSSARTDALSFEFVSNRTVSADLVAAVQALAQGAEPAPKSVGSKLARYSGLTGDLRTAFFARLNLQSDEPDLLSQRALLNRETGAYLPDGDVNAAALLKELVAWKATTAQAGTPTITKLDVLGVWGVQEDRLFPAPSLLHDDPDAVPRRQEHELAAIVAAARTPVIIHAPGGVGKSILSTRLGALLPAGSQTVVYDCYGGGGYRRRGRSRHRHEEALVQVANEFAARGLCYPLIPKAATDAGAYIRAFSRRLDQVADQARLADPGALVCVIFDAVDNAEMAARELEQGRSFAPDLLREVWPDNVRLVMLCRPERRALLDPPTDVVDAPLQPFDEAESALHLRRRFPQAKPADVLEFHRLSSRNPRVQANALAIGRTLDEMLRSFGPAPQTVDDAIAAQLETALADLRDAAHPDRAGLDRLCTALAALRPLIPLDVIAAVSGLTADAIRSFSTDFAGGRPVMVVGDAVQFRDEPVENWFRKRYRATEQDALAFLEVLKPLARDSAYVASSLPALMLEAGQLEALIDLALGEAYLPTAHVAEARDIQVQRVHFALKAALRTGRRAAIVKLALRAAEETAGEARFLELLQTHHDLTAAFVSADGLPELVARRRFKGKWLGARHAYEAALLSGAPSLVMDARIQLRMCFDWLNHWGGLPDDIRVNQPIDFKDVAAMAMAQLNIHGTKAAARELSRWISPEFRTLCAREVGGILIDHGRYADLDALMVSAADLKQAPILAGLATELSRIGRTPPKAAIEAALKLGFGVRAIPRHNNAYGADRLSSNVSALAEAACLLGLEAAAPLAGRLRRRLTGRGIDLIGSGYREARGDALRGLCLAAALTGTRLEPIDLASSRLKPYLKDQSHHGEDYQMARRFQGVVGALLPWWRARADQIVAAGRGSPFDVLKAITQALKHSQTHRAKGHEDVGYDIDEQIAVIWFDILARAGAVGVKGAVAFRKWAATKSRPLFPRTLIELARVAARSAHLGALAHEFCREAITILAGEATEPAEARIASHIDASRALLAFDPAEAEQYFNAASAMSTRVGDEAYSRWEALVSLATVAGREGTPDHRLAYRLGRCGEFASEHLDRHFSWAEAVRAVVGLSPSEGVASVSRWIDRDVGSMSDQLPALIEALTKGGVLDPVAACAFLGFRADWEPAGLIGQALSSDPPPSAFVERVLHYIGLRPPGRDELAALARTLRDRRPAARQVKAWIAQLDAEAGAQITTRSEGWSPPPVPPRTWPKVFRDLDLSTVEGLRTARARAAADPNLSGMGPFWKHAVKRIPLGREAAFIQAFGDLEAGVYDQREYFEALPEGWFVRRAPKAALEALVRRTVQTHWEHFGRKLRWGAFPVDRMMRLSGLSQSDVRTLAIQGAAAAEALGDAETIFGLVELVASDLTAREAAEGLDFGLSLMEASLPDGFGDGDWSEALRPYDTPAFLLGGLVWHRLGSPMSRVRWQAAHVARALMTFNAEAVLAGLAAGEAGTAPPLLACPRFVFYEQHARQWLLFAVARAAAESAAGAALFTDRLVALARRDNPHVVLRALAADALCLFDETGVRPVSPATVDTYLAINDSAFPPVQSTYYADVYKDRLKDRKFPIPYEFSRSELPSLANAFALPLEDIEAAIEDVVLRRWKLRYDGKRPPDPRQDQRQMADGRRMRGRDGSVHDLLDYRAWHAACVAAGRLLETRPLRASEDDRSPLLDWIQDFMPTLGVREWISDSREPAPAFQSVAEPGEFWRWSVTRRDLEAALSDGGFLRVNAYITQRQGRFEETLHIRSALVGGGDAAALLTAAQTAPDAWSVPLPAAGSDSEISELGYRLIGWISDRHRETHADADDPWAADMPFPASMPSVDALLTLGVRPQDGLRRFQDGRGRVVMRTALWGTDPGYDGESQGPRGEALSIDRRHLSAWLNRIGHDLLVCVSSKRDLRDDRRDVMRDDDDELPPTASFLFVWIKADGTLATL